jgi:hypothetical protein
VSLSQGDDGSWGAALQIELLMQMFHQKLAAFLKSFSDVEIGQSRGRSRVVIFCGEQLNKTQSDRSQKFQLTVPRLGASLKLCCALGPFSADPLPWPA